MLSQAPPGFRAYTSLSLGQGFRGLGFKGLGFRVESLNYNPRIMESLHSMHAESPGALNPKP